ncbi:hypothetical protein O181_054140 [Austropuccinia psidii MF-1]|uniref:Uncharacterized protein n=1 Tax=Austropuccinia psidii MF-1 TaxID=1389203 RepID=A0A9Q3E1W1_9BASI|nr:hypothetical protein [Austropuccinia psidii MF-1]
MVKIKDEPKERVAELNKKKNSLHNCGSIDHYANHFPQAKKKGDVIEPLPEEQTPREDFESDSKGYSILEHSDDDQDPQEEFLVDYQEETPLENVNFVYEKLDNSNNVKSTITVLSRKR